MNAPQKPMAHGIAAQRFIGQRVPRKEDGRLLTGKGTFVDDIVLPGMLDVAFVRSPIARGTFTKMDLRAARDLPGVHAILTADDLAAVPVTFHSFFIMPTEVAATPLAKGSVAYAGQPVAMVIAEDRHIAEDAAGLVTVDYVEEDAVVSLADARLGPKVHADTESNISQMMGEDEPDEDLEALLTGAAYLVEQTVVHQRISQAPMETRGVVAGTQGNDELIVHIACASPQLVARWLTMALGKPEISIRVISKDVGGSFGLKNHPWFEEVAVIVAAMILGRPIKWIEDRWESLTASNQAREQEMILRTAFDAEGRLVAAHGDYDSNNGAFPMGADANIAVHMFLWPAYRMPRYSFVSRGWYTNTQGLAAYRGPWAIESLARETLLDKAARRIGIDPIELRRRNLVRAAELPVTSCLGLPIDDISPAECFEALIAHLDIPAFRREQAEARAQGRYLGLGMATYIEPTGAAGSIGVMTGELVQIRIEPTGKVNAVVSVHSQGHGTQTTMAQVIAQELGVRYEDVTIFDGDSSRGGFSPGAGGSRQGVIGGGASMRAARLLREKVRTVAAHLLNANPSDVTIEDGMVRIAGAEEQTRSLREIAEIAYGEPARLPPGMETGLETQHRYDPPPMTFTSAAHACIVEVEGETGFVSIRRWVSSEDCGVMINPAIVEGQVAGGLAQAIGSILLEEAGYDDRGNPIAATFKDYLLPTITDVPDFEYLHAAARPANNEGGFRGVGEGGCIIGPPTLFNAIADALSPFGELPCDLPVTPSKVVAFMDGQPPRPKPASKFAARPEAELVPDAVIDIADVAPEAALLPGGAQAAEEQAEEASSKPDGAWKVVLSTPMGPQSMMAYFSTDGEKLTGKLDSDQGASEFSGTAIGGKLVWAMKLTKPMPITLKYDLQIEGDTLTGKCKMGLFGTAKVTGERV
jgi:carbon-monoxide dehydrogenase large subunit